MKDLGFGIFDRRTVIVILFTIVIVNIVLQYDLPIRINNAGELFVDLILLTGYLYLARMLLRFPFAFIFWIIGFISSFTRFISSLIDGSFFKNNLFYLPTSDTDRVLSKGKNLKSKLKVVAIKIAQMPAKLIVDLWASAAMMEYYYYDKPYEGGGLLLLLFGFFDRACLVAIVVFATLPKYTLITKMLGLSGLFVVIAIYLFTGKFSISLQDKIDEK